MEEESTEVWITQGKVIKADNFYQKMKKSPDEILVYKSIWKMNRDV